MKKLISLLIRPFWSLGTHLVLMWNHTEAGKRLIVNQYELTSSRLPKGFDGFRIVHLTDLHGRCFGDHSMELVEKVAEASPDMVVITGDMFDHSRMPEMRKPVIDLMRQLADRWPVYAILGNHEMRDSCLREILEEMSDSGVRLLRNQGAILTRNGDRIGIAGVETDPMKQFYDEEDQKEVQKKLLHTMRRYEGEPVPFRILLAHKPELLQQYAWAGADLVFSGHAHGGLMEIPFSGGKRLLAPGQGFLPQYTQGLYLKRPAMMVLSSGLGGPRLGLQPEIVQVTLRSKL